MRYYNLSQSRIQQAFTATKTVKIIPIFLFFQVTIPHLAGIYCNALYEGYKLLWWTNLSQSRIQQAFTATLERSRLIHKALNFKNPANKNICDSKPHGCRLGKIALERQAFARFWRYSCAKEPLPVLSLLKYPKRFFLSTLYFLFQLTYTLKIPQKLTLGLCQYIHKEVYLVKVFPLKGILNSKFPPKSGAI